MRIALLHSFYSSTQPSGENEVVTAQFAALQQAGHDVLLLGRHTDTEEQLPGFPVRAAWRTLTSAGPDPSSRLAAFDPDVVHVHNTVPNIGTGWLRSWRGPIVHTLHNFRPLCANGLLFRDGRLCTECPDGAPWSAIEHGCYRQSRIASLPIGLRNGMGIAANPLLRRSDTLITLSPYAHDTYVRYGVPAERLRLVPNGVADAYPGGVESAPVEQRWVAVGRLRDEKGLLPLLRGWPEGITLDIIGEGPQLAELVDEAPAGVSFLGALAREDVLAALPSYTGLVFAGLAPESAVPLVVIEALAAGIPVAIVASSPHAAELIACGVAFGLATDARAVRTDAIIEACGWTARGGLSLRERCREHFEERYTLESWVERLRTTYLEAAAERSLAAKVNS